MTGPADQRAAAIAHHARNMRRRSREEIATAAAEFERADAAFVEFRSNESALRKARDDKRAALARLMEGRSRVLVGASLITCNAHGGVQIEHVDLLGDVS